MATPSRPAHPRPRLDDRTRRLVATAVLIGLVAWAAWIAGRRSAESEHGATLVVYAFTGIHEVVGEDLGPAFRERWRRATGEHVELVTTYAGSGAIVQGVLGAVRPQVAILASEVDALRLQGARETRATWRDLPHGGVPCRTPLVIRVRPGNPQGIATYADLGRLSLDVLLPDPSTSGLGEWSVLAVHAPLRPGEESGRARPDRFWANVGAMPASAEEATRAFEDGRGDAWIAYESFVVATPSRPRALPDVVRAPAPEVLVCEPIVVRLDANVPPGAAALVDAFLAFLWSEEAQRIWARHGFHPVLDAARDEREDLPAFVAARTLETLGGAAAATRRLVELVPADRVRTGGR